MGEWENSEMKQRRKGGVESIRTREKEKKLIMQSKICRNLSCENYVNTKRKIHAFPSHE